MTFTRYELTIPVELMSELHIGGVDQVPERDGGGMLIRFCRNGLGELTIPGRSIRGAIRAACDAARTDRQKTGADGAGNEGIFCDQTWQSLWGDDSKHTGKPAKAIGLPEGAPLPIRRSALTFHAVPFPENTATHNRHGVGINRSTGAASRGALYEHEFLPRGIHFTITITAEGRDGEPMTREQSKGIPAPASSADVQALLGFIVSVLQSGTVALGGRTGSGQGTIQIVEPQLRIVAQTTDTEGRDLADVVDALLGADDEGTPVSLELGGWTLGEPARVTINWWSPTGVFVAEDQELTKRRKKEAQEGGNGDANEIVEPLRDPSKPWQHAQLLIPGTSIRGVLRSRAARIARTVLAADSKLTNYATDGLHEQIAREPNLVRYLFGSTEYRGAVTVHDCLSTDRGTRIEVTHNAIDRWTGGVIDGGLFTEAVYLGTRWEPIRVDIDLRRLLANIESEEGAAGAKPSDDTAGAEKGGSTSADCAHAAYVLLGLVFAELAAGTLPLGSRSTRGLGQVVVSSIGIRGASRGGVEIPPWESDTIAVLRQPGAASSPHAGASYDSQHALVGQLLTYLKKVNGATKWSSRLRDGHASTDDEAALNRQEKNDE